MDMAKIKDYGTTLALAAIPVVVAYQGEIGKHIPVEYALIFTIVVGILSQLMGNARVKEALEDTNSGLDIAQAKAQEYQDMVAKLQAEIDERQALVNKVTGITEEPVEGQ